MEKCGDSTWTQLTFTHLVMTIKSKNGILIPDHALVLQLSIKNRGQLEEIELVLLVATQIVRVQERSLLTTFSVTSPFVQTMVQLRLEHLMDSPIHHFMSYRTRSNGSSRPSTVQMATIWLQAHMTPTFTFTMSIMGTPC